MEFLRYIYQPKKVVESFKEKYSYKTYVYDLLFVSLFVTVITFAFSLVFSYFNLEITHIWFPEKNISYFLKVIVLAPILEEFIFRAPLKFTKKSLWCFCIGFIYLSARFLYKSYSVYVVIGFVLLAVAFFLLYKYDLYKTYFKLNLMIYLSALLFGVVHLQNLDFDYTSVFGAVSYVFPIFFGGLALSYIRLKYSLMFAILFHGIHNLIAFMIFIFN